MKKIFIYLTILLMGVVFCSFDVHAIESSEDTSSDVNNITEGYINVYYAPKGYQTQCNFASANGGRLCLVKWTVGSEVRYTLYSNDAFTCERIQINGTLALLSPGTYSKPSFTYSSCVVLRYVDDYEVLTDLPIFDSANTEAIETYLENGDTSGAENGSAFRDVYDESVPLPHNLKVIKGINQIVTSYDYSTGYPLCFNRDVVVSWEQSDVIDGLKYDIEVCFYYVKPDLSTMTNKEYNTAFYSIVSSKDYGSKTSVTETLDTSSLNKLYDMSADKSLSKMCIRVRNKASGKSSNVVSVTIDFKTKSATANEDAYENDEDVKNEYVDTDVNSDASTGGGSSSSGGDISLSGVMSFIRDGFGLLGNNGIIALLSSTFLYLPNSIWTMLKFLVAMMIAVCIVKLVKDVVT